MASTATGKAAAFAAVHRVVERCDDMIMINGTPRDELVHRMAADVKEYKPTTTVTIDTVPKMATQTETSDTPTPSATTSNVPSTMISVSSLLID